MISSTAAADSPSTPSILKRRRRSSLSPEKGTPAAGHSEQRPAKRIKFAEELEEDAVFSEDEEDTDEEELMAEAVNEKLEVVEAVAC